MVKCTEDIAVVRDMELSVDDNNEPAAENRLEESATDDNTDIPNVNATLEGLSSLTLQE